MNTYIYTYEDYEEDNHYENYGGIFKHIENGALIEGDVVRDFIEEYEDIVDYGYGKYDPLDAYINKYCIIKIGDSYYRCWIKEAIMDGELDKYYD